MPRLIALLHEDLQTSALGLPSVALEEVDGECVLARTVRALLAHTPIESVALLCPPAARERLAGVLAGLAVSFHDAGEDDSRREFWRRGRKWALSSWRSGLAYASVFDEWGTFTQYRRVLAETGADALIKPSALNPLVDGLAVSDFVSTARQQGSAAFFLPAPPGFAYEYYEPRFLEDFEPQTHAHIYFAVTYAFTIRLPITAEARFFQREEIVEGRFRVSADHRRGLELVRDLVARLEPGPSGHSTTRVQAEILAHPELWARRLPREFEIEITGRDDLPSPQRPRPRRTDLSFDLFARAVDEIGRVYDDAVLTIGGHGEPLLAPELPRMLEYARKAGVWGIHVVTNGVALEGPLEDRLLESIDCLTVRVDAEQPEVYRELNGADLLDRVRENTCRFYRRSRERMPATPYVVAEMVKRAETMRDLEPFYDRWAQAADWVVVAPFNDYSLQLENRSPLPLHVSQRSLCQKIMNTLSIHSDGRVPACPQDYLGRWSAGDLATSTLEQIWTGPVLTDLRLAQSRGRYDSYPLCPGCRYWHSV